MIRVMVSVVERDAPVLGVRHDRGSAILDPLEAALLEAGLCVTERGEATAADVIELGSSWAKRLGIPKRRPAWRLTATRPGPAIPRRRPPA